MKLVFFIGHAGVGKTTISEAIVKKTNAVYVDKDVVGKHYLDKLCEVMGLDPNDRDSEVYQKEFRDIEYRAMVAIAAQNLALGNDVYLVAPFTKEMNTPHWLNTFFNEHNLPREEVDVKVVVVTVDALSTQKERILQRNAQRDAWKVNYWEAYEKIIQKEVRVTWNLPAKNKIIFHNNQKLNETIVEELRRQLES